ncbi:MAG: carboxylesterase family protein [Selenomonadaceae bacterium]|nr:carboxylesterase family protein [Selenomonadaceae bacterium]
MTHVKKAPIVSTTAGKVQGVVVDGVACFKGIPYAAPPLGELRWRPPQVVKPWSGILQATEYKARAAQNADLHEFSTAGLLSVLPTITILCRWRRSASLSS